MKKLLFVLLLITSSLGYSQDQFRPWAVGIGFNTVDISQYSFSNVGDLFLNDYIGPFVDTNTFPFLSRVYVARYLNKNFTLDLSLSYNKLKKQYGDAEVLENLNYLSSDLGVRYDLNNVIGQTAWFDPYVKLGAGLVVVESDDISIPLHGGIGFNSWINDKFGVNFETVYKSSSPLGDSSLGFAQGVGDKHFQHSISFVYRFGAKDRDKDGVVDKEDLCPDGPGEQEFSGCPDSDKDGVIDEDDACPEVPGVIENKGCPKVENKDTDGDGVLDSVDLCPKVAGYKSSMGCPDLDNDGVMDDDDRCPNMKGSVNAFGCPDSDKDGVPDYKDNCPEIPGTKEANGCGGESKMISFTEDINDNYIKEKGETIETVEFKFGSVALENSVQKKLNTIVELLLADNSSIAGFYIEGHTDSIGSATYNMKLSKQRAESVVNYVVSKGVDPSRLFMLWYGEEHPLVSNATADGRAKNRRVEISVLVLKKK